MASITYEKGQLVYRSQFDRGLVAGIKSQIPPSDRKWDTTRKVWLVDPKHVKKLQDLTLLYLDENIQAPIIPIATMLTETRLLKVMYIGATKERPGAAERSSYGNVDGSWSVIFPERVLLTWFGLAGTNDKPTSSNLYTTLGITAAVDQEGLKKAFRRMARQWHPDVCEEPDATEVFQQINRAYQILNDPGQRARYDAGLALEASMSSGRDYNSGFTSALSFRPPLRCGWILCEGINSIGGFVVNKIMEWEDIIENGRTLVTSWQMGSDTYIENWV